ncbi:extracellular solute-binding protein [Gynuella sunshinyii]|uniref:ABC-type sugar transport system, periplasmic component n=1 Tax=Gynuella sunshinyii YC6258 TaxID=1445510 RepID=A0A0C5VJW2_9GAMM|nr:extracellular solute-binding protein [Gynuella sunshinyii]AJQ94571.1 ABC-type sugar transport system, periplasmic component [Gynuella sunshinyii YC6258]
MKFLQSLTALALWSFSTIATMSQAETVTMLHEENKPEQQALWDQFAREFEAQHPGVKIEMQYMENEQFKAKLPTLLQSDNRPNIFYSWGGGNFIDRAKYGVLDDITAKSATLKATLSEGSLSAFTYKQHIYGVPYTLAQVGFWYNKALFAKAGVKGDDIKTWDDFLNAVKKLKKAGVTPIALGAADKWPAHFYWTYLAMRTGGASTFNAAMAGDIDWDNPDYVQAGKLFQQLVALDPFQPGYAAATYGDASGKFGDQEAAMHLMGDWEMTVQKDNSADKQGIPRNQLGFFNFPSVKGGKGSGSDTLGGVTGFAFSKDGGTDTAVKWMEYFLAKPQQMRLAKAGVIIPVAKGADDGVEDPFRQQIAANIANAQWHQVYLDQALGADIGGTINDFSAMLATGDIDAKGAVEMLQEAWEMR